MGFDFQAWGSSKPLWLIRFSGDQRLSNVDEVWKVYYEMVQFVQVQFTSSISLYCQWLYENILLNSNFYMVCHQSMIFLMAVLSCILILIAHCFNCMFLFLHFLKVYYWCRIVIFNNIHYLETQLGYAEGKGLNPTKQRSNKKEIFGSEIVIVTTIKSVGSQVETHT